MSGGPGGGGDGESFAHWTPRPHPARVVLAGRYTTLEPLDPVRHGDALFAAAIAPGADDRFRYLWDTPPTDRATFDAWTQRAGQTDDPLFFAVIDHRTGRAEGRQSLMRIDAANGVAEIGHILWGPAISRTRVTTEAFALMAAYVFETLGYRRFEWKCDNRNAPSKRAALRFGFAAEGLFRKHMIIKGYSRDTAWFAMTDDDWSVRRAAFAEWLAPENFDETGAQRRGLAAMRAAAP
ncbi:GNAT family protein [Gemmatimonas sp.]|uniref:GNAT family N-acetyltransferase n=1 Tax=Gemmatimonas sp. TaxID=1962908 RepID=UPI0022CC9E5C|nr:GNAT family protein [Gemmatimonas sp.]MCZ8202976.1 GNAT family protein [Gemmatimonas sp.]